MKSIFNVVAFNLFFFLQITGSDNGLLYVSPEDIEKTTYRESEILDGPGHYSRGWYDITDRRKGELLSSHSAFIERAMYYTNIPIYAVNEDEAKLKLLRKERVVLFLFHGTFTRGDAKFSSDKSKIYQDLKEYAQTLGDSVELVSIAWSGSNKDSARKDAEEYMRFIFERLYHKKDIFMRVNLFGYSHGGNIANLITKNSFFKNKIHDVISIYTPIQDHYAPDVNAITGNLYHFYSDTDWVQYIATFKESDWSHNPFYLLFSPYWFTQSKNIYDAMLLRDDRRKAFPPKDIDRSRVYNYRVMINGKGTGHSMVQDKDTGYFSVELVIKYLDRIIKKTLDQYTYNIDLVLNIDSKDGMLDIAINKPIPPRIAGSAGYYKIDPTVFKEGSRQWKMMHSGLFDTFALNMQLDLQKENIASEAAKKRFEEKYRRPMSVQ